MLGRSAAAACERCARNGLAANPLITSRRERSSDCMASAKNYTSYAQTGFLSKVRCSVTLQVFLSPAQRLLKREKREDLPAPDGAGDDEHPTNGHLPAEIAFRAFLHVGGEFLYHHVSLFIKQALAA